MEYQNIPFAMIKSDFDNKNTNNNRTAYSNLIKNICWLTNAKKYLELGVGTGICADNISNSVDRIVCVDIVDRRIIKNEKTQFHTMTTDCFFENYDELVGENMDIIFIDADHNFRSVKKDFDNSVKKLNKYGIIILDDTDPVNINFTGSDRCGDAYKIVDYIRNNYDSFDIVTLPILCKGMSIVTRKNDIRI